MLLSIEANWENLETGSPEERACFAEIGIRSGDIWLTEAEDTFVKRVRTSVHLSAYGLAEWLAWNWWRLRWEPRTSVSDWQMSHHLTTIGGGYVWPDITIMSDGERVTLLAKPTSPRPVEPLRYLADIAVVVRADDYERAVSRFVEQVQGQLRTERIDDTNLDRIWADVCIERGDPSAAERRRLEALLGQEPYAANDALLDGLIAEADILGEDAVREIAVMAAGSGHVSTAASLEQIANERGVQARPGDAVQLAAGRPVSQIGQVPAWRRGVEAAQAIREQERLGVDPISNERLADLCGVAAGVLEDIGRACDLSFAMDDEAAQTGKVVLRSKWRTGRRFDLARLLGDRIAGGAGGRLYPATGTATYRQKFQRSFAAELLCPYDHVEAQMAGDYSDEKQDEIANIYAVSPLTVRTLLVNRGRIDREGLDRDYEASTAA